VALDNMRGLVILLVLAFHSVMAYLGFLGSSTLPFPSSIVIAGSGSIYSARRRTFI
jgi:hypothetical protein